MNLINHYGRWLKARHYSKHTIVHYLSDLKLFKQTTSKRWRSIKKQEISAFVREQERKKHHAKTINRRLYVIQGFYQWLKEEMEWPVESPVRKTHFLRQGRPLPKALHDWQVAQLFEVIDDPRDRAIFSLMLRSGLRVGEVAHLKMEQVDLFQRQLRFTGKGGRERVVPLSHEVLGLLVKCVKLRPEGLSRFFWNKKDPGKGLQVNSIQRLLKRYGLKANLEVHCHLLRHTFAKQMTEQGIERTVLQDLLGHASFQSTDGYGKLSDPFIRESYFKAMHQIIPDTSPSLREDP